MGDRLHRLNIDGRDAALRILHHHAKYSLAVGHTLFRHAAQIDRAEYGAVLDIGHGRVPGRMAENIDPFIEGVEVDSDPAVPLPPTAAISPARRRCVGKVLKTSEFPIFVFWTTKMALKNGPKRTAGGGSVR